MSTVEYIEQIEQPEGGYIPPEMLEPVPVDDDDDGYAAVLNPEENVSPDLIGTAVDHMTRFGFGLRAEYAFAGSLAEAIMPLNVEAWGLISGIKYLNEGNSIINALKLSEFDAFLHLCERDRSVGSIDPDKATIENVKIMVKRSCRFFGVCVPNLPNVGFMTFDTLWHLSTSEMPSTKEDTLRLLIDWGMGLDSVNAGWFQNVKYLGIYNPRLNEARRISVDAIPKNAIAAVEKSFE